MQTQEGMIQAIIKDFRLTQDETGITAFDERIRTVMTETPREWFIPPELRSKACYNSPLPIGSGQTISQPFIVALMTQLLGPEPGHMILEVGTGSCYQAVILSKLVKRVYSLEIIPKLSEQAAKLLREKGCKNVVLKQGDGYYGWPDMGPFDGIIVTAAAPSVPPPLIEQLRIGGRMVIPVGPPHGYQELLLIHKKTADRIDRKKVLGVAFVPLTGNHL